MKKYISEYFIVLGIAVAVFGMVASVIAPIVLVCIFGASPWWFMLLLVFVFALPIPALYFGQ